MPSAEIDVSGMTAVRGNSEILSGVDIQIDKGRLVAIIGPSGCGKTTLMRAVAGLDLPAKGSVRIQGEPADIALRHGHISLAFQDPALLPWLSCWRNAGWLAQMRSNRFPASVIEELSALVELDSERDLRRKYPGQVSGGERQRVALIRALCVDAPVLLLDEPFSALDHKLRTVVVGRLRQRLLHARQTCLLVTHDLRDAVHFADLIVAYDIPSSSFSRHREIDLPLVRGPRVREEESFSLQVSKVHQWAND